MTCGHIRYHRTFLKGAARWYLEDHRRLAVACTYLARGRESTKVPENEGSACHTLQCKLLHAPLFALLVTSMWPLRQRFGSESLNRQNSRCCYL